MIFKRKTLSTLIRIYMLRSEPGEYERRSNAELLYNMDPEKFENGKIRMNHV